MIFSDRSALKCLNAENIESTNCEIADVQWCNNYIFHMLHVLSKVILENYFAFLICLKTKKVLFLFSQSSTAHVWKFLSQGVCFNVFVIFLCPFPQHHTSSLRRYIHVNHIACFCFQTQFYLHRINAIPSIIGMIINVRYIVYLFEKKLHLNHDVHFLVLIVTMSIFSIDT